MLTAATIHGKRYKICMSTITTIPPSEYTRILQTKSSPEIIAVLLNEAETSYSSSQKKPHGNAKRVYPFWKICKVCLLPFPCQTKEQAVRNTTCGVECLSVRIRAPRRKKPLVERTGLTLVECAVCGTQKHRARSTLRNVKKPTCSRRCNGILRGAEWGTHAHKGRAAWSPEAKERWRLRMLGASNPAWKGGVTYFRKHGNYKPIKYVRCPLEFLPMARKDGYVMEHRLIVAKAIGRLLLRTEVVHHEDHDPQSNGLSNLMLFASNRDHKLYEHRGSPEPIWRGSSPSTTRA